MQLALQRPASLQHGLVRVRVRRRARCSPDSPHLATTTFFDARRGMSSLKSVSVRRLKVSMRRVISGESTRACWHKQQGRVEVI